MQEEMCRKKDPCYGPKVPGTNAIPDISWFTARLKQRHCLNCGKKEILEIIFRSRV